MKLEVKISEYDVALQIAKLEPKQLRDFLFSVGVERTKRNGAMDQFDRQFAEWFTHMPITDQVA